MTRGDKYRLARSLGYTPDEASKMRNWGEKRLTAARKVKHYETQKRKEKAKREKQKSKKKESTSTREPKYLLVGYKDKTDQTDTQYMADYTSEFAVMPLQFYIEGLRIFLSEPKPYGYLGDTEMENYKESNLQNAITMMRHKGYIPLYKGQGKNLKTILAKMYMAMELLYEPTTKYHFIKEFTFLLSQLNNKKARENASFITTEIINYKTVSSNHF